MGLHLKELEESFEKKVGGGEEIPLERICISFCWFLCASPAWHSFLLMYMIRALPILGRSGVHTCWRPAMLLWTQVDIFCHYSALIFKTGYLYSYPLTEEYGFTHSSPFLKVSYLVGIDIFLQSSGQTSHFGQIPGIFSFSSCPKNYGNWSSGSSRFGKYFGLKCLPHWLLSSLWIPTPRLLQHLKVVFFKIWCPEFLFVLCRIIIQVLLWILVTKAWNWDFMEISAYSWSSQVTSCVYNIHFKCKCFW